MAPVKTKYILIPEFKPLFAMRECYGPPRGPLEKPCPTPINVIGKLLKQDGQDALTIYEVVKLHNGKFSTPVQLYLNNYTLPYEEILNGKTIPEATATPVHIQPVEPVIQVSAKHKIRELNDTVTVQEKVDPQVTITEEDMKEADTNIYRMLAEAAQIDMDQKILNDLNTTETESVAVDTPVEEANTINIRVDQPVEATKVDVQIEVPTTEEEETPADPYKGMTKAERKAARRAEREAQLKAATEQ